LNSRHSFLALVAAFGVMLSIGGARANTIPGDMVSGPVTAVAGIQSVSIQGQVYRIKAGSPAAAAAAKLSPGQVVDAQLNGPAGSSSSQVVNIIVRSGR
jgi:hypothetical protein